VTIDAAWIDFWLNGRCIPDRYFIPPPLSINIVMFSLRIPFPLREWFN
jgi:hypothetical protein